jgi:predicted enzyme related to lactoylglutathione lyase
MSFIKWFEIPVEDLQRAVAFYSNVFRVSFEIQDFSGIRHAIFKKEHEELNLSGALVEIGKFNNEQIGPILFFDANSGMTDIIDQVIENGGEVLLKKTLIRNVTVDGSFIIPKTLIDGETGYFSYVMDSEGNKLGLYSNS